MGWRVLSERTEGLRPPRMVWSRSPISRSPIRPSRPGRPLPVCSFLRPGSTLAAPTMGPGRERTIRAERMWSFATGTCSLPDKPTGSAGPIWRVPAGTTIMHRTQNRGTGHSPAARSTIAAKAVPSCGYSRVLLAYSRVLLENLEARVVMLTSQLC
jgi:hypothetical protein